MSKLRRAIMQAASGAAAGEAVYIDDVFSTYLYDGTGSAQTITNGVDLDGEGGLVWIKGRSNTGHGTIFDTERGVGNFIMTSLTNAEGSSTAGTRLTAFNSDGFSLGTDPGSALNFNTYDYASWTFRKQPGFFDVVTYTGTGSTRTVSHNIGSTPGFIIIKRTDSAEDWTCWHNGVPGAANYIQLNKTDAYASNSTVFNNTAPTDSVFTVGSHSRTNALGGTYVAYLFAHDDQRFGTESDESIVYCGTYEGNGSTKAVTLGWEPQWCLIKNIDDSTNDWQMFDTMRGAPYKGDTQFLNANDDGADAVGGGLGSVKWYPTSTGFEVEVGGGGANDPNENNETYIFMAIRRPHKPAEEFAATDLFDLGTRNGVDDNPIDITGVNFPVDAALITSTNQQENRALGARLTGKRALFTDTTGAEFTRFGTPGWDHQDGVTVAGDLNKNGYSYIDYFFKRAPGFFDVVAYTGQSAEMEISHNLGVTPELIIQKCRTQGSGYNWNSWYTGLTNSQYINLNTTAAVASSSNLWGTNSTVATDSIFRVGAATTGVNGGSSNDHIAYLFATVPGISKIGTVSHTTGSTTDVDCGFSSGARFVLVKRVDSGGGHWVLMDSVRGINAGNDPYLLLSSNSAEVTGSDVIDPLSSGFQMQGFFATGTWLFLAIA